MQLFDEEFRKPFPNVTRYFMTLVNQPEFKKVLGDVSLAKEAAKYTPKAKEAKPAEQPKKESKPGPTQASFLSPLPSRGRIRAIPFDT